MDNQPTKFSSVSPQPKRSLLFWVFLTFATSAILFGFGGYYLGNKASEPLAGTPESNLGSKSHIPTAPASVPSPTADALKYDYSDWQSHKNTAGKYMIEYPKGWRIVSYDKGAGYGPQEIGEDVLWGINFYSKVDHSLDMLLANMGSQFGDRRDSQQTISIRGIPAIKHIVTTSSMPGWYSESIIIESNGEYIVISNGALSNDSLHQMKGVKPDVTFEQFYQSFRFLN